MQEPSPVEIPPISPGTGKAHASTEERLERLEALMSRLLQDYRIGASLTGPLPEAPSSMSLRHRGDEYYFGGCLAIRPTFDTLVVAANRLYAVPFYVPSMPNRVDRIAIRVTATGGAPLYARLGIYDNGENLYPGRLLLDAGTVPTDTTGTKTITTKKSLFRGLKWLVAVFGGTPTLLSLDGFKVGTWGVLGAATGWSEFKVGWSVEFTYAALPAKFPAVGGATKRSSEPVIALRFM